MSAGLVVVSNRGPLAFHLDENGEPVPGKAGGGLASTLGGGVRDGNTLWIAAAMTAGERVVARNAADNGEVAVDEYRMRLVDVGLEVFEQAYNIVSNQTLWFWHHHMFDMVRRPTLDRDFAEAWKAFRSLNNAMATAAVEVADKGATILVHDYHLALAPAAIRALRPDVRISHFTHTPFVSPALLSVLPDDIVGELLHGMAGADACGFHAPRWADAFRACWAAHDATKASPAPRTYIAPAAADHDGVADIGASERCATAAAAFDKQIGDKKVIVRVDRIEPSKNLLRGFWAYRTLLETHPEWHGEVCMLALCYPSREGIDEYKRLHDDVEIAAKAINEMFGTETWTPILLETDDAFPRSVAALKRADVLFVNPIRDGLNLVAYEGTAINEKQSALVLSREAGAWDELGPAGAITINPFDIVGTADALHDALRMSDAERAERHQRLVAVATARTPADWLQRQLDAVSAPSSSN